MSDKNKAESNDNVNTQPVLKSKLDLDSGKSVLDPLTLRDSDTSRLKKIKPKSATQTINLDSENISDTVHLKVIKEKKKQLAGILTASQTIRLRPPSAPQPAPQTASTLKTPDPSPSSAGTVNMPPQTSPAGTLKINMPASSSESGTIKVAKPNFADTSSAGTLKIKSPEASATSGGTLKIKSAATASASGTLKLKAAASSDETVKLGADKKGGTLKLKAKSTISQPTQSVKQKSATQVKRAKAELAATQNDPKSNPGIVITLTSILALAASGMIVYTLINSYQELFKMATGQ